MSWVDDVVATSCPDESRVYTRAELRDLLCLAIEYAAMLCDQAQSVAARQSNLVGDGGVLAARVLAEAIRKMADG